MSSNFTFTLQVMIGITPALEGFLARVLAPCHEETQAAIAANQAVAKANEAYVNALAAQPSAEAAAPQPDDTLLRLAPQDAPGAEPADDTYDVTYVREAIDRTRRRIEGELYKNETTSERYQKYHKPLTAMFKQIALQLSGDTPSPTDKPTELPNGLRKKFSDQCDEIYVDENGELSTKLPF